MATLVLCARAGEIGLIPPGDRWKHRTVTTDLNMDGWHEPGYNDSAWLSWMSGFFSRGNWIPGTAEASYLQTGPDIVGHAFRNHFTVEDLSYIKELLLRIDYEHGFVAYLNGGEVARRGIPAEQSAPVPFAAFAAYHERGNTEVISIDPATLRVGNNVLAISSHRASETERHFCMVAELMANFSRAPIVTKSSTTSTVISWQTAQPTRGRVEFGKSMDQLAVISSEITATRHEITLSNLEPGTLYHYRVWTGQTEDSGVSDWATFRALKPPGQPIRFGVVGDTGQGMLPQYEVANGLLQQNIDLLMHVGDIVYPSYNLAQADARHFSVNRALLKSVPMYAAMGNHDGLGLSHYTADFIFPTNNGEEAAFRELYYSFDHGDAHFVVVATDTYIGCTYYPGSEQYKWLEADLAATKQPWKFLFFHHVLRTSALHRRDDYLHDGIPDMFALRQWVGALAARYGAQIIFNGHDHDYERFAMFDGVSSYITGGGGASLYPREFDEPGSEQFYSRHHFMVVDIDGSQLTARAISNTGEVFDRYYRSLSPPSATLYSSQWGSPLVENSAGADGDGNITGQTFDFTGAGIPTLPGLRANLGRLHVRNDATHLYIGFEQASIHPDQFIGLFVENPLQPGISDLGGLGNSVADETEQGADGLDALTHLRFRNFQPSVGALLGDERADTHVRGLRREGGLWGVGQGVFRLDQTFTTIDNARLQQFNRSPQLDPQVWEENADLIEVAIPLSELGSPRHPDTVRIGAVALATAGAEFALEADRAFAGRSLVEDEGNTLVLEPIVVQLAEDPFGTNDPYAFVGRWIEASRIQLTWRSSAGARYHIQATEDLSQPFADIDAAGLPVTAIGAATAFEVTPPTGARTMFYRLSVLP